jgi:hypothetical protein
VEIVINTERLPPDFWWRPEHPVRGTEEFYIEAARALHRRGVSVTVEKDPPYVRPNAKHESLLRLGVERGEVGRPDVVIDCNPRTRFHRRARKVVIWSSLFGISAADLRQAAGMPQDTLVCGISDFHVKQLDPTGTDGRTRLVPLGVDKSKYATDGSHRDAYLRSTGRRLALFSSSPDRGLEVVKRLEQRLAAEGVDLLVSGYPGGPKDVITDEAMVRYYQTAHYWLHPGLGNELFCLAAAKAQAAGACPIVRTAGALVESVRCGFTCPADESIRAWEDLVVTSVRCAVPRITADHLLSWSAVASIMRGVLDEA